MIKQIAISFLVVAFSMGCASQKKNKRSKHPIKQGIAGQVFEISGNVMPSPDDPQPHFPGVPMKSTVAVFPILKHEDLNRKNGFYMNLDSTIVAEVLTNEKGEYTLALPVGSYSVLLKMKDGFYANRFDEKMQINPVTVFADSITQLNIRFDLHSVH